MFTGGRLLRTLRSYPVNALLNRFPRDAVAMKQLVEYNMSSGKQLRARLVLDVGACYKKFDTTSRHCFFPLAAAVETLHTAMLIADDCCDDAGYRRGKLSWRKVVGCDAVAWNDANLLAWTAKQVLSDQYPHAPQLGRRLDEAVLDTIYGQRLDLLSRGGDLAAFENIAMRKTGVYTFALPLMATLELCEGANVDFAKVHTAVLDASRPAANLFQAMNDLDNLRVDNQPTDADLGRCSWVGATGESGAGLELSARRYLAYQREIFEERLGVVDDALGFVVSRSILATVDGLKNDGFQK
uniref:Uncharacterized protein n=1 Tax=viral metagenome TaxID=1070528 RepID=A0A6C0KCX9_9ZZZZ